MPKTTGQPEPDEFGRLRVRDVDTGHERTIHAAEFGHGRYIVLDTPASDVCGDPVPPVLKFLSEPTNRGRQADSKKENSNG